MAGLPTTPEQHLQGEVLLYVKSICSLEEMASCREENRCVGRVYISVSMLGLQNVCDLSFFL